MKTIDVDVKGDSRLLTSVELPLARALRRRTTDARCRTATREIVVGMQIGKGPAEPGTRRVCSE